MLGSKLAYLGYCMGIAKGYVGKPPCLLQNKAKIAFNAPNCPSLTMSSLVSPIWRPNMAILSAEWQ